MSDLVGQCAGCGVGIPFGYVPLVTKWRTEKEGGWVRQIAETVFCRRCPESGAVVGEAPYRRKRVVEKEEYVTVEMSAKEVAIALIKVLDGVPHGSKTLAKLAGIEYTDMVPAILKKLAAAGKIQKVKDDDGGVKWAKLLS